MLVLDASAAAELVLGTALGGRVRARLTDQTLHAPHLLDVEVASVLRRLLLRREIRESAGTEALSDLAALGVERYDHEVLLPRILELRTSVTAYDAAYVALAEVLDAPVLTCDSKLDAAHGHRASVELVAAEDG